MTICNRLGAKLIRLQASALAQEEAEFQMLAFNRKIRSSFVPWFGVFVCVLLFNLDELEAQSPNPPSAMKRFADRMNPMRWQLPDFRSEPSKAEERVSEKANQASFFDDVSNMTKRGWLKTKDLFNPSRYNPARLMPASTRTKPNHVEREETGFWGSLFSPKPEPKEISNVNDFLRQSRPGM